MTVLSAHEEQEVRAERGRVSDCNKRMSAALSAVIHWASYKALYQNNDSEICYSILLNR